MGPDLPKRGFLAWPKWLQVAAVVVWIGGLCAIGILIGDRPPPSTGSGSRSLQLAALAFFVLIAAMPLIGALRARLTRPRRASS